MYKPAVPAGATGVILVTATSLNWLPITMFAICAIVLGVGIICAYKIAKGKIH